MMSRVMEFYSASKERRENLARCGAARRELKAEIGKRENLERRERGTLLARVQKAHGSTARNLRMVLWRNFSRSFEFLICPLRRVVQLV